MRESWTKQRILDEIQILNEKERFGSADTQKKHNRLYHAGMRHFGSWRNAVIAAGFNYPKNTRTWRKKTLWTREKIIARILEIYQTEGRANYDFVSSRWPVVCTTARREFGKYKNAVEAAGLNYDEIRIKNHRLWSEEKILSKIKQRRRKGLSLCYTDVYKNDCGLAVAALRHIGSWSRALKLAGFDPNKFNKKLLWTKDTIVKEIRKLSRLGLPLNLTFIKKNRPDLFSAVWKRGEGWAKAVAKAGFDYEKIKLVRNKYWTKEKILNEIKRLEKKGVRLNTKTIQKNYSDIFATACVLFGTWGQAVEAAGISYQSHCMVWTTKAWLLRIKQNEYENILEKAETYGIRRRKS